MDIQNSIRLCMRDYEEEEYESAMLHICTAIDGVAGLAWPWWPSKRRFLKLIRDNYHIIEPIAFSTTKLKNCLFPIPPKYIEMFRQVNSEKKENIGKEDLANLLYVVHRCAHCHGNTIPSEYRLITEKSDPLVTPDSAGHTIIYYGKNGSVRISKRIIPALVMVIVLQPIEWGRTYLKALNKYSVYCEALDERLPINDWWERKEDFIKALKKRGYPENTDRSWIITELGKDSTLVGFAVYHESDEQ